MSWADDLTRGFQAGSMMAGTVMQGIRDEEDRKERKRANAIQEALLQKNNPGLYLSPDEPAKQVGEVDGTPVMEAKATPFKANDQSIQRLADGAYFSQDLKKDIDKDILKNKIESQIFEANQLRPTKMADLRAEEELKNEMLSKRPQSFAPGTTLGSIDDLMHGKEGIHIQDRDRPAQPFHFEKAGNKLLIFRPGETSPASSIDVPPDADVKSTGQGIFKEKTPGKGDYELVPGTQPIQESKPAKMNTADEKYVDTLATKNANKVSVANQLETSLKILEDPKVSETDKVREGESLLKVLNSPEGSDAVGKEEASRIGTLIQYQMGNFQGLVDPTQKFIGRDIQGFASQIRTKAKSLRDSVKEANREIDKVQSGYGIQSNRSTPSTTTQSTGKVSTASDYLSKFK